MKRYSKLWDKICTIKNFYFAFKNAVKGKSHYKEVRYVRRYGVHKYLKELLKDVTDGTYEVSKYHVFYKVTGGKVREIYKLPMRDRIVLHAIMLYLEPIFRKNFIVDTFSSIKNRGIHRGLQRIKNALRKYDYRYCLTLDIKKCYPSIDKNILKSKLAKKFKDQKLLLLLFKIIDSCEKGVPIGNYTSQYFNNFYFSDFDHWVKEVLGVKSYFRYCDDMKFLSSDKTYLHNILINVVQFLNKLHVFIKLNYQITDINKKGVDFLGYITRKGYSKIRKYTKKRFINKTSNITLSDVSDRDINVLGSYWGFLKHADCRNLWFTYTHVREFKQIDKHIKI